MKGDSILKAIPTFEGISIIDQKATKRKIFVTPEEMKELILAGNPGVPLEKLGENVSKIDHGGVIVKIDGTNFVYGGLKTSTILCIHVKKELLQIELFKLYNDFPQLKPIE